MTTNLLPEGEHEARLIYIADLGLQRDEYRGTFKGNRPQMALGLEILGHEVQLRTSKVPQILWTKPFNVFDTLVEKSLETQVYKIFDPTVLQDTKAYWKQQLSKPCTVVVKHTHKYGNAYNDISDLLPIPQKYQEHVPPATLEVGVGDSNDPDNLVNKRLFGLVKHVFNKRIIE